MSSCDKVGANRKKHEQKGLVKYQNVPSSKIHESKLIRIGYRVLNDVDDFCAIHFLLNKFIGPSSKFILRDIITLCRFDIIFLLNTRR